MTMQASVLPPRSVTIGLAEVSSVQPCYRAIASIEYRPVWCSADVHCSGGHLRAEVVAIDVEVHRGRGHATEAEVLGLHAAVDGIREGRLTVGEIDFRRARFGVLLEGRAGQEQESQREGYG